MTSEHTPPAPRRDAAEVTVADQSLPGVQLEAYPYAFGALDRYVVAMAWGDEDDSAACDFESCGCMAVTLDLPSALHNALRTWLQRVLRQSQTMVAALAEAGLLNAVGPYPAPGQSAPGPVAEATGRPPAFLAPPGPPGAESAPGGGPGGAR